MSTETMTPAQELRAAASKISYLIAGTPPGPWSMRDAWRSADNTMMVARIANADHEDVLRAPNGRDIEGLLGTFEHIATWHPGVAELVAEWLAATAEENEKLTHLAEALTVPEDARKILVSGPFGTENALRIARAINGEVAA